MQAREALINAGASLHSDIIGGSQPRVAAGSELARRLGAAALSCTFGRDLLHTQLARDLVSHGRYLLVSRQHPPGAALA